MPPLLKGLRSVLFGKGLAGARGVERAARARLFEEASARGTLPSSKDYAKNQFLNYIETQRPGSIGHWKTPPGVKDPGMLRAMMLGSHGPQVLRARYHMGGLLGKGGLLRGELATHPEILNAVQRMRAEGVNKADMKTLGRHLPGDALSKLFVAGLPAYGVASTLAGNTLPGTSPGSQIGQEFGTSAAMALAGPLGMAGLYPASYAAEYLGDAVGGLFDSPTENKFGT